MQTSSHLKSFPVTHTHSLTQLQKSLNLPLAYIFLISKLYFKTSAQGHTVVEDDGCLAPKMWGLCTWCLGISKGLPVQCRVGCVGGQHNSLQGLLVMTSSSSCGQWCLWVRPLVMRPGLVGGRLIVFISIFCTCFCGVYSNNGYKPVFVAVSCMRCKCDRGPDILKLFFFCFFFQCTLANLLPILRLWRFLVKVSQRARSPEFGNHRQSKTVSTRWQNSLCMFLSGI